jgi:queuosine precursor transporter
MILVYLLAVVAANLAVAHFGPASTPLVAFALIGLDVTARDALHERWRRRGLFPKMLALVAGSLLSAAQERALVW